MGSETADYDNKQKLTFKKAVFEEIYREKNLTNWLDYIRDTVVVEKTRLSYNSKY